MEVSGHSPNKEASKQESGVSVELQDECAISATADSATRGVCVRIFTASMLEDINFIFHLGKNSESQALNMQSKQTNQCWYEYLTFALERDKSSWKAGIIFAKKLSVLEIVIKFNFYAALCVCVIS